VLDDVARYLLRLLKDARAGSRSGVREHKVLCVYDLDPLATSILYKCQTRDATTRNDGSRLGTGYIMTSEWANVNFHLLLGDDVSSVPR